MNHFRKTAHFCFFLLLGSGLGFSLYGREESPAPLENKKIAVVLFSNEEGKEDTWAIRRFYLYGVINEVLPQSFDRYGSPEVRIEEYSFRPRDLREEKKLIRKIPEFSTYDYIITLLVGPQNKNYRISGELYDADLNKQAEKTLAPVRIVDFNKNIDKLWRELFQEVLPAFKTIKKIDESDLLYPREIRRYLRWEPEEGRNYGLNLLYHSFESLLLASPVLTELSAFSEARSLQNLSAYELAVPGTPQSKMASLYEDYTQQETLYRALNLSSILTGAGLWTGQLLTDIFMPTVVNLSPAGIAFETAGTILSVGAGLAWNLMALYHPAYLAAAAPGSVDPATQKEADILRITLYSLWGGAFLFSFAAPLLPGTVLDRLNAPSHRVMQLGGQALITVGQIMTGLTLNRNIRYNNLREDLKDGSRDSSETETEIKLGNEKIIFQVLSYSFLGTGLLLTILPLFLDSPYQFALSEKTKSYAFRFSVRPVYRGIGLGISLSL